MADKTTKIIEIEVELEGGEKVTKQFEQLSDGTLKAVDSAKKLNDTLDDTAKANDEVNKSFDKGSTFAERYGEELQPLTTRMGEAEDRLYELALAGDTTSREYQQLLEKVGQYRQVQIETDLAVDQAAKTMSQKLGAALTGAASGFTAATGLIGLMGTESQELEKLLLKVNAAMAFQQGVEGIREYTKSVGLASKVTKVWNAILALNPITLLIASITTAVGLIASFIVGIDGIVQGFKNLTDWIGLSSFAEMDAAKERRKNFKEAQKQREAERLELIELQKQRDIYNQRLLDYDNAEIERLEVLGKNTFEKRKALLLEQKLQAEQNNKFTEAIRIQTKLIALEKERNQKAIDFANKRLQIARQIEDLEIEIMEDAMKKELRQNQVKFDRLIEDTKKNTEINAKERKRLIELFLFQQQEAENEIRNKFRREELDAEKANGIEKLNIVDATAKEEVKSTFNMYAAMGKISSDYYKKEKELREKNLQFALNSATEGLDVISNFAQQSADKFADLNQQVLANEDLTDKQKQKMLDKNNKRAKKAFNVQKAASIAAALVTTYQSATQAYASQFLPLPDPSSPVRGGIAAGLAVAAGLANVANISKQKFEGASLGSTQSASTDVGGGAPSFNVVGDSGVNQLAQLQQQPTQAFVVSGEVTTAQALDRNRVQNATL